MSADTPSIVWSVGGTEGDRMVSATSLIAATALRPMGILIEIIGLVILGIAIERTRSGGRTKTTAAGLITVGMVFVVVGLLIAAVL